MTDPLVLFETLGPVARLTLNRPEALNALNLAMLSELDWCLSEIAAEKALRVVVVTGSGPAFCAGADLQAAPDGPVAGHSEAEFLERAHALFARLRHFPKPVICALNGATMAGGLELALCADLVVAADGARLSDAHTSFSLYSEASGAAILPRLMPLNRVMYLLLTGKSLSATEMKACGLVCEVHPDADLARSTLELANQIAKTGSVALQRLKEVARASAETTQSHALLRAQAILRQHLHGYELDEASPELAEKPGPRLRTL